VRRNRRARTRSGPSPPARPAPSDQALMACSATAPPAKTLPPSSALAAGGHHGAAPARGLEAGQPQRFPAPGRNSTAPDFRTSTATEAWDEAQRLQRAGVPVTYEDAGLAPQAAPAAAAAGRKRCAAPKITPGTIGEGRYEIVKAPDHAETRAWLVLVGGKRAGPGPPHMARRAEPARLGGGRQRRHRAVGDRSRQGHRRRQCPYPRRRRGQPAAHTATTAGKRAQAERRAVNHVSHSWTPHTRTWAGFPGTGRRPRGTPHLLS
jgi:hypothetical protein